ncbi:MAG: hypothetical protein ABIJ00_02530 [Candidatus Eisenbacteria bacterium]
MKGVAAFAIYLIGALYGVEVQHSGWFVTGRQKKRTGGMFVPLKNAVGSILGLGTQWFFRQPRSVQTAIISALHIHNHVPVYEWPWERYAWQYSVFDAAWYIAERNGQIPKPKRGKRRRHADRFYTFARAFHMRSNKREFCRWAKYRNDLIHQVTWGKNVPGHIPRTPVHRAYLPLRSFTTMALLASIGYNGATLRMPWNTIQQLGLRAAPEL